MPDFKYLNLDRIDERVAEQEAAGDPVGADPNESLEDVLVGTILELCQFSEMEGMSEDEVDRVLRRVIDARANRTRERFRLVTD